ncbi:MAG: hypothetical protein EXR95_10060 [Gemmatimonadetes bacterium]|nr:hypothetical protein [Gemmatimonadota bacterium]
MPDRASHEDLMRYLDGEMPLQERSALELELGRSTELQRELAIYQAMQSDFRELSFAPIPPSKSVWGQVNRRVTRPLGWIFLVGGAALWIGFGAYVFAVSSVNPWERLAVAAIVIGLLLLLASVIVDRYREWLADPYRDIQR